jgi:hypothetical protein
MPRGAAVGARQLGPHRGSQAGLLQLGLDRVLAHRDAHRVEQRVHAEPVPHAPANATGAGELQLRAPIVETRGAELLGAARKLGRAARARYVKQELLAPAPRRHAAP